MKFKHFFALALLAVGGGNLWAQQDVTSTYLVNPSFETLKAADGTTDVDVKTTLSNGLYGWEVVSCSNYQVESYASKSSTGFPADGSGQINPTDGTYYYFNRQGWGPKNGELKTTTSQPVPAGLYYFSFDYKAADYSNNNNAGNNGTTLGVNVYASDGSTKLASLAALRHSYSIANNGSNPGNDAYMVNAGWKKMGILFRVDNAQELTFSIVQNLKNNGRSDVVYDNCRLVKVTEDVDITGMVANYDFEQKDANGWTNGRINNGEQYTGAGNAYYLDVYNETRNINQKFDLPAGVYKMTAKTRGIAGLGTANIYLNDGSTNYSADIEKSGSADNTFGNGWGLTTVNDIIIYNDATVTYGFYSECGSSKWAGGDDFTLTYKRDLTEQEKAVAPKKELLAAINAVVVPTTNIGTAAFQYHADRISAIKDAIKTAQGVYDNPEATPAAVNEQIAIIKALTAPALNVPTAGQRFHLNLNSRGTTTFVVSPSAQSGYSITFNSVESNNYPQAFELTPVVGAAENDMYILSFTDNDGETRYICNGIPYGAGTGAYGIRTITDSEKALVVKVVATATEGEYNLLNTSTDGGYKKLGSNGGDFYTDDKYSTFTITEAGEIPGIKIGDAGYATYVAPVDVTLPTGVTAYTVTVSGESAILTKLAGENETLEAGKAVVVTGPKTNQLGQGFAKTLPASTTVATEDLTGAYVLTPVAAEAGYMLQKNNDLVGFYKVTEDAHIGANRCYLATSSSVKAFFFDAIADAIQNVEVNANNETIYDLSGRKVAKAQKGLYIINGKKVIR